MTRTDEIKARLEAAKAEHPYEVADRHEIASRAWSDLYQHAPSDLEYLLRELKEQQEDNDLLEKELAAESSHRADGCCAVCDHMQRVDIYEENERLTEQVNRVVDLLDKREADIPVYLRGQDVNHNPFPLDVLVDEVRAALDGDGQ